MKYLLIFIFLSTAHAGPLDNAFCSKEVKALGEEWKATGNWIKHHQNGLKDFFWASPTPAVGEWVLYKSLPQGSVLSKVNASGRIESVFKSKNCEKETSVFPQTAPSAFKKTDKDIEKFVTTFKKGVIYVWSKRMGLSEKGVKEIKEASQKLKLPVLVLEDVEVDSLEFRMRNVDQHYPAILVFKDSKISSEVKYGFEKSDRYQSDLIHMLRSR